MAHGETKINHASNC